MYKKILVALENSPADENLMVHVTALAVLLHCELLLLHVADGVVARNFDQLKLNESEEMKQDRMYLEQEADKARMQGVTVTTMLAMGEPSQEILKAAQAGCDLIAMGGHGHRLLGDLVHGSTIYDVRHETSIPVLLVRAEKK